MKRSPVKQSGKKKPACVEVRRCRVCGCTDDYCFECVEATGQACYWVEGIPNLCSRCAADGFRVIHDQACITADSLERDAAKVEKLTERMWAVEKNREEWLAVAKWLRDKADRLRAVARTATEGGAL